MIDSDRLLDHVELSTDREEGIAALLTAIERAAFLRVMLDDLPAQVRTADAEVYAAYRRLGIARPWMTEPAQAAPPVITTDLSDPPTEPDAPAADPIAHPEPEDGSGEPETGPAVEGPAAGEEPEGDSDIGGGDSTLDVASEPEPTAEAPDDPAPEPPVIGSVIEPPPESEPVPAPPPAPALDPDPSGVAPRPERRGGRQPGPLASAIIAALAAGPLTAAEISQKVWQLGDLDQVRATIFRHVASGRLVVNRDTDPPKYHLGGQDAPRSDALTRSLMGAAGEPIDE